MKNRLRLASLTVFATTFAMAADAPKARRLEAITWNPVDHKLTWVISVGEKGEGQSFKATSTETYNIEMDKAVMAVKGEARGFSEDEAATVHKLMDIVSKYAVESTVWWDAGQGTKLDKNGKPLATPVSPGGKQQQRQPRKPGSRIAD
jgi:hypothetical protein